jgi:hypothetical protein
MDFPSSFDEFLNVDQLIQINNNQKRISYDPSCKQDASDGEGEEK